VKYIDFHANYLPLVDHPSYLPGWVERQVRFWTPMAEQAEKYGIVLLLENMWEPDPAIINSILDRIPSPYLKACLDVGHAALYSRLPPARGSRRGCSLVTHLQQCGDNRLHLAFGDGVNRFPEFWIAARPPAPVQWNYNLAAIKASLPYFAVGVNERRNRFLNLNGMEDSAWRNPVSR
jgi:hypothetical protein